MLYLVYGQSASGKSEYAENLAMSLSDNKNGKVYIATMEPFGAEAEERIKRHRALRSGKGFETIEKYTDIGRLSGDLKGKTVLLECMSNLVANELFAAGSGNIYDKIMSDIIGLNESCRNLIVVSLDVFEDSRKQDNITDNYMRCLAMVNKGLASMAGSVMEVVYSIPVRIK